MYNDFQLEQLVHALANAAGEASEIFSSSFPTTKNPFHAIAQRVYEIGRANQEARDGNHFYFGTPMHKRLLDRFEFERQLHQALPNLFPKPEEIVFPPAVRYNEKKITASEFRDLLRANVNSMTSPRFVWGTPAYRIEYTLGGSVKEFSILNAYGETIETQRYHGNHLAISYDEALDVIDAYLGHPPVEVALTTSTEDKAYDEVLRSKVVALRDAMSEARDTFDEKLYEDIRKDLQEYIIRDRKWSTNSVSTNRVWWRQVYFVLVENFPTMVSHWEPITLRENKDECE